MSKLVKLITEVEDLILSCESKEQAKNALHDWMLSKRNNKAFVQLIQPVWLRGAYLLDNFEDIKKERQ